MRIDDALDRYVLQLRADGRSEHTVRQYQRHVRLLARWLDEQGRGLEVDAIDHETLARFLVSDAARLRPDGRPKKATAMNALRSSIRTFFAYLAAAGFSDRNPARLVRRARCAPPPPRALSEDETRRLLETLDAAETDEDRRDAVLFHVLLGCGLRIGSALALRVEDVDFPTATLFVRSTKGNRPMSFPIPPLVVARLHAYVASRAAGPLFPGRPGQPITARHAHRRLESWLARVGITRHLSPHALRHTYATTLYRRCGDLLLVKRALGHASIASTAIYAEVDDTRVRALMG